MANQVLVETSARHVHVTQEDLETLFGKWYELTVKNLALTKIALNTLEHGLSDIGKRVMNEV